MSKKEEHIGNEKHGEAKLEEKLDKIIIPLVEKFFSGNMSMTKVVLHEIIAVAVLEGVKLAELVDAKVNEEIFKIQKADEIIENMKGVQRLKDTTAVLNITNQIMGDGLPRFVTPDQLDENGKFKK